MIEYNKLTDEELVRRSEEIRTNAPASFRASSFFGWIAYQFAKRGMWDKLDEWYGRPVTEEERKRFLDSDARGGKWLSKD